MPPGLRHRGEHPARLEGPACRTGRYCYTAGPTASSCSPPPPAVGVLQGPASTGPQAGKLSLGPGGGAAHRPGAPSRTGPTRCCVRVCVCWGGRGNWVLARRQANQRLQPASWTAPWGAWPAAGGRAGTSGGALKAGCPGGGGQTRRLLHSCSRVTDAETWAPRPGLAWGLATGRCQKPGCVSPALRAPPPARGPVPFRP